MNDKKYSKILAIIIVAMLLFVFTACNSQAENDNKDVEPSDEVVNETLTLGENVAIEGEKPVLRIMNGYNTNVDLNEDVMAKLVEEITGYQVEWYNLPSDNPTQALLLDISSGSSYDLLYRVPAQAVATLYEQGALMDLREDLTLYGNNIIKNSNDSAWIATTSESGQIFGIPYTNYQGSAENPYGSLSAGMAFSKSALEDLGMEMPETLEELEAVCEAYMKKTGQPAITYVSSPYISPIAYAFGVNEGWSEDEDGNYISRIRKPEFLEYITYVQNFYKKGYIDTDLPINNQTSAMEKFTTGKCLAYGYFMFWDCALSTPGFEAVGLDSDVVLQGAFAKDSATETTYTIRQTYTSVCAIPKNAENAEHAMAFLDALSESENFKKLFIGEEGVTYKETEDGELYPIFPAFDTYYNADRYVGIPNAEDAFYQWRCRARKTDEFAELYNQLCEQSIKYKAVNDYNGYAISVPEYLENNSYLTSIVSTRLMAGIASNEAPQVILDGIINEWEANGGIELEEAMNDWWQTNKAALKGEK